MWYKDILIGYLNRNIGQLQIWITDTISIFKMAVVYKRNNKKMFILNSFFKKLL